MQPKINSVQKYLSGVSSHIKSRIYTEFHFSGEHITHNDYQRQLLLDAVIRIRNELENGQSHSSTIKDVVTVQNRLMDDLKVNEFPPWLKYGDR